MSRKLTEVFAESSARVAAEAALRTYLLQYSGQEPERVALAILKISRGDQLELQWAVEAARTDVRDVLAWAQYPEEMTLGPDADPEERRSARARDLEQYRRWLGDDS